MPPQILLNPSLAKLKTALARPVYQNRPLTITLHAGRHILPSTLRLNASQVMPELWLVGQGDASLELNAS